MKNIFDKIKGNPLFFGIGESEFQKMIACLDAKAVLYQKGEILLRMGEAVKTVGIVLSGSAHVIMEDFEGKQHILAEITEGELFAEVFACAGMEHSPVMVRAAEKAEILFIYYRKMITTCGEGCTFHHRMIENMLTLLAKKNLMLNQKIEILSKRTIRERLLVFLERQRGVKTSFAIPYNREELAAYLCVDRSALSAELSKMKKEGILAVSKNQFTFLQ